MNEGDEHNVVGGVHESINDNIGMDRNVTGNIGNFVESNAQNRNEPLKKNLCITLSNLKIIRIHTEGLVYMRPFNPMIQRITFCYVEWISARNKYDTNTFIYFVCFK